MSHLTAAEIVRDHYLATPEGRQQLKQMIEEAEQKEAKPQTLDHAIGTAIGEAFLRGRLFEAGQRGDSQAEEESYQKFMTDPQKHREAIKAAAQREYGKAGIKDDRVSSGCSGDKVWVKLHDPLGPDGGAVGPYGFTYYFFRKDLPGILYALSTLEGQ